MESAFKWTDNSPLDYVNWKSGEPNNWAGFENCVEMQTRSGQWNDLPCNYNRQFICKKKMGENIQALYTVYTHALISTKYLNMSISLVLWNFYKM